MKFLGLLYVKHGLTGSKSEGPDYWLQTAAGEYLLRFHDRPHWEPDFELEFYNRRFVEVDGEQLGEDDAAITVTRIRGLPAMPVDAIPQQQARLGEAFRVARGERVALIDAPVEVALTKAADSRCPTGAQCFTAGEAVLGLEVAADGAGAESIQLTLEAGNPERAAAAVGAYRIEATRLDPYPALPGMGSGTAVLDASVATLIVTRPQRS